MEKTYSDYFREAMSGWEKSSRMVDQLLNELLPIYFLTGFILGCINNDKEIKKALKDWKVEDQNQINLYNSLLRKGIDAINKKNETIKCLECGKEYKKGEDLKFAGLSFHNLVFYLANFLPLRLIFTPKS